MKRALKWVAIVFALLLLLVVAAVLAFPYWFGTALGIGGKRFGFTFAKYERLDKGRFALTDVVRTNRLFDLRISRVEGYQPYTWYQKVKATNHSAAFAEVNGWRVVLHPGQREKKARSNEPSVYGLWKEAERSLAEMRQWLPRATFLNGAIDYEDREYTFPVITWDEGKLDAGGVWAVSAVPFEVKGKLGGAAPYQLSFSMPSMDLRFRVQAVETNGLLNTKVAAFYKDNRADVNADFGHEGMLPERATVKAPNLKIPGELVHLDQYNELTGSLSGAWQSNMYRVQLNAHAEPIAGTQLPPADIELAGRGDTNTVTIEQAKSTATGLQVSISDPIQLTYRGQLLSERSELKIDADLGKLPWLKVKGQFAGTLLLKRGEKFPIATLRAAGTQIEAYHLKADSAEISGTVDWPRVEGLKVEARLDTNSTIALEGSGNVQERRVGPSALRMEGRLPTSVLPANVSFERIHLEAKFSGHITNLTHEGKIELRDLVTPQTQPIQMEASWKAQQITFEQLALRARAGPAALFVRGRGNAEDGRTNFIIQELTFGKGDEKYLGLTNEATLSLGADRSIELTPLHLVGNEKELTVDGRLRWPTAGRFDLEARNISPTLVQSFVTHSLRELDLRQLAIAAQWSNGPLAAKVSGNFSVAEERLERVGADLNLELDEKGLTLSEMNIFDTKGQIGAAHGLLPLAVNLTQKPLLELSKEDRIDFEFNTTTNQGFWNTIQELAKVRLTNAAVDLVVHGTTERPMGEFHMRADAVQIVRTNREWPAIGPLDTRIALNERVLRIREFSARVFDQPIHVSGRMALGTNFWTQRREEIARYALDNAELKIEASDVALAPFTEYLPKYLSPQGKLLANIEMKPGRNLEGRLEVHGVETRPLPDVGVVQSIRAAVNLHGKQVEVRELSGVLGGERMTISGRIDLSPESVAKGYPDVDFSIKGKDLPLARNPDVILRSDLDLHVRNGTNQIPTISGTANLRDSFLLRDVSTMVPGRLARPMKRPPYFSIEQDPVDEWKLDVNVTGDKFMRVRSPFFEGVVSASFRVIGTAREPMALGEGTINSGQIIFPFATLEVRQALVSLTAQDPYLPHIFAVANGRSFGFDIRMEAEGPADKPDIRFTSVPALSSEQIVLMLTTGQIPRDDFTFSTKDRLSKLAMFLGKSLISKLHPGKPQEEKLTIRSGQDVTEQGRQTYEVEYKLTPRWSLVGEYDRFGAVNADVKWRLISR